MLLALLEEKNYKEIRGLLEEMNVVGVAAFIEELKDDPRAVLVFRLLPKELAAEVFSYLASDPQQMVVNGITDRELRGLVGELFLDDTVDFLEEMPASIVKRVISAADPETRREINRLLMYPEDSAGSLMTIEYLELDSDWTVVRSIQRVRTMAVDRETISVLFITDLARRLVGTLRLQSLLTARDDEVVGELMDTDVIAVNTHEDQAVVAEKFKTYDVESMPVVDNENRLVGIITIDDVVDVIEEETTEDIYKMAAMQPIDSSYMETGVLTLSRKRFLWLAILMISATFTGIIIEKFQSALAVNVLLAAFIPMLMDTSGNAGSQASVSVIRATVLGELQFGDVFRVIWKEFRVSLITGTGIAVLNFLRIMIMYGDAVTSLIVSITLFIAIIAAKFVGCTLPLLATKLRLDPALMASPLITTIVDAVALLVYFNVASLLVPAIR